MHKWFYAVEVLDESLNMLSIDEIERRLNSVVADVGARIALGETAVPVALLSADERDRWAEVRTQTLSRSAPLMSSIESCAPPLYIS